MGKFSMTLIDTFGRVHRDLRVSLTDRCSLRCTYCMPSDFKSWMPTEELLSADEMIKVIEVGVNLGIEEVRLTGGEPLLRPDIVEIIERIKNLNPSPEISLTTNGVGLSKYAVALASAGLTRINISLDTLDWTRFRKLTFRDRFEDVIEGIASAQQAGLNPIKINTVLMRGINDDESVALVEWAMNKNLQLRFIEQMPLDAGNTWQQSEMITADQIMKDLSQSFELTPVGTRGSAPAEEFLINGGPHTVGIIASVSKPFCGSCDRLRLTSDGQLRSCLFATEETDLRKVLRDTKLSELDRTSKLQAAFQDSVRGKLKGHSINQIDFKKPDRPMSAIGG